MSLRYSSFCSNCLEPIEAIKDVLEAQLSTPIPGTPFHAIKQEKRYLIVLGKNIVCEGKDIEELS